MRQSPTTFYETMCSLTEGRRALIPGFLLATLALLVSGTRVDASYCAGSFCHYYSSVDSGTGYTNTGTGAIANTWSQYSVNSNANGGSAWSVFLQNNDTHHAIEGGFFSGSGYNIGWTNQMLVYWSINGGYPGYAYSNEPLPLGQQLWVATGICGGCGGSLEQVGSYVNAIAGGTYQVEMPATNHAQGEVTGLYYYSPGDIAWMCGGATTQDMYWGDGSGWNQWGVLTSPGADSPFYESDNAIDLWSCGGY